MNTSVCTPKAPNVPLKDIPHGTAFRYGGIVYMKVRDTVDSGTTNCIDLVNGTLGLMNDTCLVTPLMCLGFEIDYHCQWKPTDIAGDKVSPEK